MRINIGKSNALQATPGGEAAPYTQKSQRDF